MPERPKQMLSRVITISALLVVVGIAVVYVRSTQPNSKTVGTAGPRLQVDREKIDLGDRAFGQPVRAAFTVTNVGTGALTLQTPRIAAALKGC